MKTVKAWAVVERGVIALGGYLRLFIYRRESDANADLKNAASGAKVVRVEIREVKRERRGKR